MINLAVFASGNGSNAEVLCLHFMEHPHIRIRCIATNNASAGVIRRGQRLNVPVVVFSPSLMKSGALLDILKALYVEGIVLAGFLKLIPAQLIDAFPDAIVNIHPALLPAFGGPGMYGSRVHEAVIAASEQKSGITIHLVNRAYDEGRILFHKSIDLNQGESPESLATRIHQLEYEYYPLIVDRYFSGMPLT